jgi:hypothetical protein
MHALLALLLVVVLIAATACTQQSQNEFQQTAPAVEDLDDGIPGEALQEPTATTLPTETPAPTDTPTTAPTPRWSKAGR